MCNEYARRKPLEQWAEDFGQTKPLPRFSWLNNRIPNDLEGKTSVRIGDAAPIVRVQDKELVGAMAQWAWKAPRGKPVFNVVSEGRDFSTSDRVLVVADGFYEFTAPQSPKVKLKDKHLFEMNGETWFWIAGIVKDGCFALLTTDPGPDLKPYHDRQIVVLRPAEGLDWLNLSRPQPEILKPPPFGALRATTVRRDGRPLSDEPDIGLSAFWRVRSV